MQSEKQRYTIFANVNNTQFFLRALRISFSPSQLRPKITQKGPRKNAKTNSLLTVAATRKIGNNITPPMTRHAVNMNATANVMGFILA